MFLTVVGPKEEEREDQSHASHATHQRSSAHLQSLNVGDARRKGFPASTTDPANELKSTPWKETDKTKPLSLQLKYPRIYFRMTSMQSWYCQAIQHLRIRICFWAQMTSSGTQQSWTCPISRYSMEIWRTRLSSIPSFCTCAEWSQY